MSGALASFFSLCLLEVGHPYLFHCLFAPILSRHTLGRAIRKQFRVLRLRQWRDLRQGSLEQVVLNGAQ